MNKYIKINKIFISINYNLYFNKKNKRVLYKRETNKYLIYLDKKKMNLLDLQN